MSILTISREVGSGGREIGYNIVRLLNYEYIDKEKIFSELRADGGRWEEWGKTLDEHRPTIWEKYDWSFQGWGALVQSHILNYALKGNIIIMGRGGNFLLKDIPFALRIRITAPLNLRIERLMRRDSVDEKTAEWLAEKTDRERAGFINALYGEKWDDPAEYDMVFDAGTNTVEEITAIVKDSLLERDRFNTEDTRRILYMHALAAKIKAAILTDPGIFVPTFDVHFDGKDIVLRGVIHNPREHKKLEEQANKLAGGVTVRCELHYRG